MLIKSIVSLIPNTSLTFRFYEFELKPIMIKLQASMKTLAIARSYQKIGKI